MDENTELGADDLEISWRLTELGYTLSIAHDVFVRHEKGVSFRSLSPAEVRRRVQNSDIALVRKLEAYFGIGNVPTSREIWGHDIFQDALDKYLRRLP